MIYKKRIISFLLSAIAMTGAEAAPLTVCDFEDYEIGTTWTMWYRFGSNNKASTATVEADPTNAGNKV